MSKKKILIVDDSTTTRSILKKMLSTDTDTTLFEVSSGNEALEKIETIQPDLITMDIEMPGLSGFETCARIRMLDNIHVSETPIVFITSNDTLEQRQRGYRVGGNDFIIKPFLQSEVLSAIQNLAIKKRPLEGSTILVVDDSSAIRRVLKSTLEKEGVTVIECQDGMQAFDTIADKSHIIDLVLTDYMMPGMTGAELCESIRKELGDKDIPIIFLTSKREVVTETYEAGASDYLLKDPFNPRELIARIQVHLNSMAIKRKLYQNLIEQKKLSRLLDKRNTELLKKTQELEEKKNEIEHSLASAGEVQKYILKEKDLPPWLKVHADFRPHSFVSGDMYTFQKITDDTLLFFIGDATGHGVPAALSTMMTQALLAQSNHNAALSEILKELNDCLNEYLPDDRMMTAVIARFSVEGRCEICSAGHPPPVLLLQRDRETQFLSGKGHPLGMLESELVSYAEHDLVLQRGDSLFFYSDGLSELKAPDGTLLGRDRILSTCRKAAAFDSTALIEFILNTMNSFSAGRANDDDSTLVHILFTGQEMQ